VMLSRMSLSSFLFFFFFFFFFLGWGGDYVRHPQTRRLNGDTVQHSLKSALRETEGAKGDMARTI
jgi:hypothetical protein